MERITKHRADCCHDISEDIKLAKVKSFGKVNNSILIKNCQKHNLPVNHIRAILAWDTKGKRELV